VGPLFHRADPARARRARARGHAGLVGDEVSGTEAERLPLDSITYEDGDDQIAIGLGRRGSRFPVLLWHFVDRPRLLWVDDDGGGVPRAVVIASQDGTVTRLELH
jgi:hypothetical protein